MLPKNAASIGKYSMPLTLVPAPTSIALGNWKWTRYWDLSTGISSFYSTGVNNTFEKLTKISF